MDQEQIDQEQASNDFAEGFNAVRPSDDYVPPEVKEPVAADPVEPEQEPKQDEPVEEPLFAGMTESQIKSLLERSARVDGIEDQLRKAHGKIGELNGTLQELKAQKAQPTQVDSPAVDDAQMSDFERDYPEFITIADARARRIASEMLKGQTPAPAEPAVDLRSELQRDVQLGIMDAMYPDWRDTVSTQDFTLWLATQSPELQQTYASTWNAKELGSVVTGFKTWKQTSSDRVTKSKERLEDALIPENKGSKVMHATTAEDAFLSGFNQVRAQH